MKNLIKRIYINEKLGILTLKGNIKEEKDKYELKIYYYINKEKKCVLYDTYYSNDLKEIEHHFMQIYYLFYYPIISANVEEILKKY